MEPSGDVRGDLDIQLEDPAALEEIELYSELMIIAGRSAAPLTREELDRALGVCRDASSDVTDAGTARPCPTG
jgi:hypothetical protein